MIDFFLIKNTILVSVSSRILELTWIYAGFFNGYFLAQIIGFKRAVLGTHISFLDSTLIICVTC